MKLHIDTMDNRQTIVGLGGKRLVVATNKEASQRLLPLICRILKETGKSFEDVSGVEINSGPGSYTGLKVGAAVANCLGFLLNIPVNGKKGPVEPRYGAD